MFLPSSSLLILCSNASPHIPFGAVLLSFCIIVARLVLSVYINIMASSRVLAGNDNNKNNKRWLSDDNKCNGTSLSTHRHKQCAHTAKEKEYGKNKDGIASHKHCKIFPWIRRNSNAEITGPHNFIWKRIKIPQKNLCKWNLMLSIGRDGIQGICTTNMLVVNLILLKRISPANKTPKREID